MTMLARMQALCNGETHYISAWEPGDEEKCDPLRSVHGINGYTICCEDHHDIELDETIADLTGELPHCLKLVMESQNTLVKILTRFAFESTDAISGSLDKTTQDNAVNQLIVYACLGATSIFENYDAVLRGACKYNYPVLAKLTLDLGANPQAKQHEPICSAAQKGYIPIVELLISRGADLHALNESAVRFAAEEGHLDMVKFLIDHWADPRAEDYDAFISAARNGHLDVVQYLCRLGVRPDDAPSAISEASENGYLPVVKYLVERGWDVNYKRSASLAEAVVGNYTDLIYYLVDKGADVTTRHNQAVREAAANGNLDVVKFLIAHGADIRALNDDALRLAAEYNHGNVITYIHSIIQGREKP